MDKLDILINVSKLETVSQNFKVFVAWGKTGEGRKYNKIISFSPQRIRIFTF